MPSGRHGSSTAERPAVAIIRRAPRVRIRTPRSPHPRVSAHWRAQPRPCGMRFRQNASARATPRTKLRLCATFTTHSGPSVFAACRPSEISCGAKEYDVQGPYPFSPSSYCRRPDADRDPSAVQSLIARTTGGAAPSPELGGCRITQQLGSVSDYASIPLRAAQVTVRSIGAPWAAP